MFEQLNIRITLEMISLGSPFIDQVSEAFLSISKTRSTHCDGKTFCQRVECGL